MPLPPSPPVHPAAALIRASKHASTVAEVATAVASEAFVVVGMGWNPAVGKARRVLAAAGVSHTYLGYGNYAIGWRKRLAVKLWAGWPTLPMVFVHGQLVGGASDLQELVTSGEFVTLVAAGRAAR
ncbi:MAG: glutaredoxin [Myxococcales bacterium]|nr:glutaredoxin [Myxococcales bacterium]